MTKKRTVIDLTQSNSSEIKAFLDLLLDKEVKDIEDFEETSSDETEEQESPSTDDEPELDSIYPEDPYEEVRYYPDFFDDYYGAPEDIETVKKRMMREKYLELKDFRKLRKHYAKRMFVFMALWCIALFTMLFMDGFMSTFNIDAAVLVTLSGGTTVSTITIGHIIIKGLFNSNHEDSRKSE